MIIAIFGYDFHHYKTNAIIKDTFINGFSIGAVLLAPKINYINNGNIGSIDNDSKNDEIREFCKANNIDFYRIKHNDNLRKPPHNTSAFESKKSKNQNYEYQSKPDPKSSSERYQCLKISILCGQGDYLT